MGFFILLQPLSEEKKGKRKVNSQAFSVPDSSINHYEFTAAHRSSPAVILGAPDVRLVPRRVDAVAAVADGGSVRRLHHVLRLRLHERLVVHFRSRRRKLEAQNGTRTSVCLFCC